jgi:uncharacterized UPF0160 family protein
MCCQTAHLDLFLLQAIDAIDNGINMYDTDQPPKYINNTHLSSRVGKINIDWIDEDQSPEKENERFHHAMALAGGEFLEVRFRHSSFAKVIVVIIAIMFAYSI